MALLRDLSRRRALNGARPLKVILMSATLNSDLFAGYFGGCPVLAAAGRTFPVRQLFLEDAYEALQYRLAADSPAALRAGAAGGRRRLAKSVAPASKQAIVQVRC